jgi:hypothetical protein
MYSLENISPENNTLVEEDFIKNVDKNAQALNDDFPKM